MAAIKVSRRLHGHGSREAGEQSRETSGHPAAGRDEPRLFLRLFRTPNIPPLTLKRISIKTAFLCQTREQRILQLS